MSKSSTKAVLWSGWENSDQIRNFFRAWSVPNSHCNRYGTDHVILLVIPVKSYPDTHLKMLRYPEISKLETMETSSVQDQAIKIQETFSVHVPVRHKA